MPQESSHTHGRDGAEPGPGWPNSGEIIFENASLRYKPGQPEVLKNISLVIEGGWKVGVVGRTGAGKSSLMSLVFRLVEATGGRVLIDGVDVAQVGLHALRSNISIIPQDPILMAGSVRYNLDPFGAKTDEVGSRLPNCSCTSPQRQEPGAVASDPLALRRSGRMVSPGGASCAEAGASTRGHFGMEHLAKGWRKSLRWPAPTAVLRSCPSPPSANRYYGRTHGQLRYGD